MAGIAGNGNGSKARSGAQTLVLLSAPLSVAILAALAEAPMQQSQVQKQAGAPALTTLRSQLKRLIEIGVVNRQRRHDFPGAVEYELTAAGRDLLPVATVLNRWLEKAPDGPLSLESSAAKAATRALAEGWSTTMLRALAAGPLSLTDLDRVISALSYPSLERRLGALRLAAQIEASPGNGRATPYAVTAWLRQGVAPLMAAARWERRHRPEVAAPFSRLDFEASLLLALPLLRLPADVSGSCRLGAEFGDGRSGLAGAMVSFERGEVVASSTKLQGHPAAWARGSISAWLDALLDLEAGSLELGGDRRFVRSLLEDLHWALVAVPARAY